MTSETITALQVEHLHQRLVGWAAPRSRCTIDAATIAMSQAIGEPVAPAIVGALLRIIGFVPLDRGETGQRYARRGSKSAEREAALSYAREWRQRTKPFFDALYGAEGGAK